MSHKQNKSTPALNKFFKAIKGVKEEALLENKSLEMVPDLVAAYEGVVADHLAEFLSS